MPLDQLNDDFRDILIALLDCGVEFAVVGAWAVAFHGHPRATQDFDVLVRPSAENARRVVAALHQFGAPLAAHGVGEADFGKRGTVYQVGLPPRRIDILTEVSGVSFDEVWQGRDEHDFDGRKVAFIGLAQLLQNKRASGRPKDLADISRLEQG